MFHRFRSRLTHVKTLVTTLDRQVMVCKSDSLDNYLRYSFIAPGYKFLQHVPHTIKVEEKDPLDGMPYVGLLCIIMNNNTSVELTINKKIHKLSMEPQLHENFLFEVGCEIDITADQPIYIFPVYGVVDVLDKYVKLKQLVKGQVHNLYYSMILHNKTRSDMVHLQYLKDPVLDTIIHMKPFSKELIYVTYTNDGITTQQVLKINNLTSFSVPNGSSNILITRSEYDIYGKIEDRLIELQNEHIIKNSEPNGIFEVLDQIEIYEFPIMIYLGNFYGLVCDTYGTKYNQYENVLETGTIKNKNVKKEIVEEIIEEIIEDDDGLKVLSAPLQKYNSDEECNVEYNFDNSTKNLKETDMKLYELLKTKYRVKYMSVAKISNIRKQYYELESFNRRFTYKDGKLINTDIRYHPHIIEYYSGSEYAKHVASAFAIYPKK